MLKNKLNFRKRKIVMRNHFICHKIIITVAILFILIYGLILTKIEDTFLQNFLFPNRPDWSELENSPEIHEWFREGTDAKFCVWYNFTKASLKPKINSISLCTHGSIGYSKFVFDYVCFLFRKFSV